MPHVWLRRPDASVWIVGKDPPAALRRLATWHPEGLPGAQGGAPARAVAVTGTVSDAAPYLREAWVSAAPITYGVGIQNKVLEAMACGTAVVGSPQAAAALNVVPGEEMLVAEGAEAQARALIQVMDDDLLRSQLASAGRIYVQALHDWNDIAERIEGIYLVGDGRNRTE